MKNYYQILGICQDVPQEIIVAVYKTWMQALCVHPDLGGDEELAKEVNEAYRVLKDPRKRAAYDKKISEHNPSGARELRRAPRFDVDAEISFCVTPGKEWQRGRARDASALGLRISSPYRVSIGDHVSIAFLGSSTSAESRVKWVRAFSGDEFEFGVEFFRPNPQVIDLLIGRSSKR
jgi:DnaJ-class molecular chaperone